MKHFVRVALLSLAAVAVPAAAQQTPAPAAAPAPAAGAPGATAPATGAFNLDTPIEAIVANEKAKAALMTALGADITANPFYEQIKAMSFNQVQPISNGALSDETMKKIADALAGVK